jgi:hypothetical protein
MLRIQNRRATRGKKGRPATRAITFFLTLAAATAVLIPRTHAGEPGSAGALFLRIGMGARATAMGEAFVGVAEDPSAVYWNPGAMSAVLGTHVMFMHNEYTKFARLEQVALTHETDYGTVGLGFTGLFVDDMERREDVPVEIPLGEFAVYDVSVTVGFSRYIAPNLSVGATLKPIYQKIDERTAKGVGLDVGVYHISRIEGVKLAAVVTNVGKPMKFIEEEYALPRCVKVGGSYERELEKLRGRILLTVDGVFPNDGDVKEHAGLEYRYRRQVSLRAGYKAGYDSHGATFGVGVRHREFDLDYAVMLIRNDLGDSHRISLSMSL